jgi:hypothetical protein
MLVIEIWNRGGVGAVVLLLLLLALARSVAGLKLLLLQPSILDQVSNKTNHWKVTVHLGI